MSDKSRGFTLMELIAVIIIGILLAITLPRLVDLTNETLDGSVQGVAGALGSASASTTQLSSPTPPRTARSV
jgi:type II secretory pathway pseudopilin PulG